MHSSLVARTSSCLPLPTHPAQRSPPSTCPASTPWRSVKRIIVHLSRRVLVISSEETRLHTCSACDRFLAPPRGIAPLAMTQPRATAETGTSWSFAIFLMTSNKGSSCSIGILENLLPDGGGLVAEYFPVRRPIASGESVRGPPHDQSI
jgi:hypothetical protein